MKDKMRQSNIELCRLASILMVMLVHTTSQSLGDDMNFWAHLLEAFSVIGVNVFILITGYFSATPKKSSLINLAFICLFWMLIKVVANVEFEQTLSFKFAFFLTNSNWFIASYIGLLFLAPVLNSFCKSASKRVLMGGVFSLLLIEMWFDWLPPYPAVKIGANNGYSVLSFAILYLLARAIKIHGLPEWFKKDSPVIYIMCSFLIAGVAQIAVNTGHRGLTGLCYSYINPVVIFSSVAFLMMFERISIQSKVINHMAKSTLAVLLGHSAIFFIYTKQFKYIYDNFSGIQVVGYWALAIIIVFCASIAIDQLRLLLYKPIEDYLKKHIQQNEIFKLTSD